MLTKKSIRNLTILIGSVIISMGGTIISPVLPEISAAFQHVPNADFLVKLILTIPSLTTALSAPFLGVLLDRWGRKPVLLLSVIVFAITGASGYVLNDLTSILIGRALLGLAGAGLASSITTLIADYFSGDRRNQFMGYQAGMMGFGGVAFFLISGYLADISWRLPFLVYLAALIILPGILFAIEEPKSGLNSDEEAAPDNTGTLQPRKIALVYAVGFISMVIIFISLVQAPFFLKTLSGVSNSQVGTALAIQALLAAIASLQYQKIKARLSYRNITSLIFLLFGIGYFIIGRAATYPLSLIGLIISGMGIGLLLPNINVWVVRDVPHGIRGRVVGGLTTFAALGQFFSPVITQPIAQQVGLRGIFITAAGASVLIAVFLYLSGVLKTPTKGTIKTSSVE